MNKQQGIWVSMVSIALALGVAASASAADEALGRQLSRSTKLTGYYPHGSAMQGGFKNRYGGRLFTLQQFLRGEAPYVTVALDYKGSMKRFNKKYVCIPDLERAYASEMKNSVHAKFDGRIPFKVMDTGGRFVNRGWAKMDICNEGKANAYDKRVQQKVEIYDCDAFFQARIKTKAPRE